MLAVDKKLALDIFRIASPSREEEKMLEFIKLFLVKEQVEFKTDTHGNVFNITKKGKPLLSCHTDTVQDDIDAKLARFIDTYEVGGKQVFKGLGVIGGDDKCGVYTILEILKQNKDINFVFSTGEEVGGIGIKGFADVFGKELEEASIPYGIIIDRRGKGDIICDKNSYGTKEFEAALLEVGKEFGYTSTSGSFSDANTLKKYFSCANISSGYHNPHRKCEYVVVEDLERTLNFVNSILTTINATFPPVKEVPVATTYYGGGAGYRSDYWAGRKWNSKTGIWEYEDSENFHPQEPKKTETKKDKKEKKSKIKTTTNGSLMSYYPYVGTCSFCGAMETEVYGLSEVGDGSATCCTVCLSSLRENVDLIEEINDPFFDGGY